MDKRVIATAMLICAVGLPSWAADNPLDPAYKARLTELRDKFFDMVKTLDVDGNGLITEKEYCAPAGEDPLSPAYKKRQAEFREMLAKLDTGKDGTICLEEYVAATNPLHPGHKR